jgi:hypothetical protein
VAGRPVRLFISHSSHAAGSLDALTTIAETLKGRGIDVRYDKTEITTGDEWRQVINAMLADCDAAAFIVTPGALTSEWVLKEANILLWRRARNPDFLVLPVCYGEVDAQALTDSTLWKELEPLQLGQADTPDAAAGLIADKLAPLGEMLDPTPLGLMAIEIAARLEQAPKPLLHRARLKLDPAAPATVDPGELADAIARWMLAQEPPALKQMAAALSELGDRFVKDDLEALLDYVMPLWVDPDAASWLTRPGLRVADRHGIGIACTRPDDTVEHFVKRAHVPGWAPEALTLNAIADGADADDIEREVKNLVRNMMEKRRRGHPARDRDIDRLLKDGQLFVAVPLPDDESVITALRARYARLNLVFHAPISEPRPGAAGSVAWITPALKPTEEDSVWADYWQATTGGTA